MKQKISGKEKLLLSGNEAIARGAYEAGVKVAASYPGTPSTEILENISRYEGIYTEWAPNEKVALEVALGASFAGARALASMKQVGLNVAADPLFTSAYTGVRGGLVIVTTDDPSMHSSQNEQDSRNYAFAAKIPMLEPSDPSEAKELTKRAFQLSEDFDIPVLIRTTTRVSHVKGLVQAGDTQTSRFQPGIVKMPEKFVMLPSTARERRADLEERLKKLRKYADSFPENRIEWGDRKGGFITSGVSYLYVKEIFPHASVLKLGMVYPFPEELVKRFADEVDELIIIEELDPFLEIHIKAMGIRCTGKALIPSLGELNPYIIKKSLNGETAEELFEEMEIPLRHPTMCPGCAYRGLFYALSQFGVFVAGDIGCYTLGFFKPLSAVDSCICMGASIGNALGMEKALGKESLGKIVAVIGDSTFIHSGITALIDVVYNRGCSTVVILDNRVTAMTGLQPNPTTGYTISRERTHTLDFEALCRGIGVEYVRTIDTQDIASTYNALKREIERPEPSVVIARCPCVLSSERGKNERFVYTVIREKCTGCRECLELGCPAVEWTGVDREDTKEHGLREDQKGYVQISRTLCTGCSQCAQLCTFEAIEGGG